MCSGATLMATHAYTRNPESSIRKEIDLQQWDTRVFKGEHAENEHWMLAEDRNGQVGYAPAPSGILGGHPRHASRGRRRYQEGTREHYRGKPDWRKDWTRRENEGRVIQQQ